MNNIQQLMFLNEPAKIEPEPSYVIYPLNLFSF